MHLLLETVSDHEQEHTASEHSFQDQEAFHAQMIDAHCENDFAEMFMVDPRVSLSCEGVGRRFRDAVLQRVLSISDMTPEIRIDGIWAQRDRAPQDDRREKGEPKKGALFGALFVE